jgi:hypothetical protein
LRDFEAGQLAEIEGAIRSLEQGANDQSAAALARVRDAMKKTLRQ